MSLLSDEDVVPLLGEKLIQHGNRLVEEGTSRQLVKNVFETVCVDLVKKKIGDLAIKIENDSDMKVKLSTFLTTQLPEKLFGSCPEVIADTIVNAVHATGYNYDDIGPFTDVIRDFEDGFNLIGINKVSGASVDKSFFVEGIAFKARGSHEGVLSPKIHKEVNNAKILLVDIQDGNCKDILKACEKHHCNVVLSSKAIDDGAKKKLAKRRICVGDLVAEDYLDHVAAATSVEYVATKPSLGHYYRIGTCERFRLREVQDELFGICSRCPRGKTATIVLRGDDQFVEEAQADLSVLIPYVRGLMKDHKFVAGGHLLYTWITQRLLEEANYVDEDSKPIVKAFSEAIKSFLEEKVDNVGDNAVNNPSQTHGAALGEDEDDIVWEPPSLKIVIIGLATKYACIRMDDLPSKGDGATSAKRKTKRTKKRKTCDGATSAKRKTKRTKKRKTCNLF